MEVVTYVTTAPSYSTVASASNDFLIFLAAMNSGTRSDCSLHKALYIDDRKHTDVDLEWGLSPTSRPAVPLQIAGNEARVSV
jgi:hypothetical protein